MNYLQFRKTFLDSYTANLLETDLSNDYNQYVRFVRREDDPTETTGAVAAAAAAAD